MNSFRTEKDTDRRPRGLSRSRRGRSSPRIPPAPGAEDPHRGSTARWRGPPIPSSSGVRRDTATSTPGSPPPGILDLLLDKGFEYAFISNSDNLGAVLDPDLLRHMIGSGAEFMMEVADRTPADRKGGHLCRLRDGRSRLARIRAVPTRRASTTSRTSTRTAFSTPTTSGCRCRLSRLSSTATTGSFPWTPSSTARPSIPATRDSPAVVQLETAMGAAISLFDRAIAVRVPRRRFSPVKNTDDLLGVRSDAFELTDDGRIVLAANRNAPPTIQLDPRYFKLLDDFDQRFPAGPPSLVGLHEPAGRWRRHLRRRVSSSRAR